MLLECPSLRLKHMLCPFGLSSLGAQRRLWSMQEPLEQIWLNHSCVITRRSFLRNVSYCRSAEQAFFPLIHTTCVDSQIIWVWPSWKYKTNFSYLLIQYTLTSTSCKACKGLFCELQEEHLVMCSPALWPSAGDYWAAIQRPDLDFKKRWIILVQKDQLFQGAWPGTALHCWGQRAWSRHQNWEWVWFWYSFLRGQGFLTPMPHLLKTDLKRCDCSLCPPHTATIPFSLLDWSRDRDFLWHIHRCFCSFRSVSFISNTHHYIHNTHIKSLQKNVAQNHTFDKADIRHCAVNNKI